MRIIGIDPGLRYLGWGVIEADGPRLRHISNGVIEGVGDDLAPRLLALYDGLIAVLAEFAHIARRSNRPLSIVMARPL